MIQLDGLPIPIDELPSELAVPAVLLIVSLAYLYRRKETLTIYMLNPEQWSLVKKLIQGVRKRYYTRDVDVRHLRADASLGDVERALLKASCEDWDILSYHYEGERLNYRKICYDETVDHPLQQDHFRAFVEDGMVTFHVHRETRPKEYPSLHLDDHNMRVDPALETLSGILADHDIPHEAIVPSDGAGATPDA